MVRCPSSPGGCNAAGYDPSQDLGAILYNGPYDPQLQNNGAGGKPPYQNFSVQVPPSFTSGEEIALVATHLNLVGVRTTILSVPEPIPYPSCAFQAGPFTNLQTLFVPLTVA